MKRTVEWCDWCGDEGIGTRSREFIDSYGARKWTLGLCGACVTAWDTFDLAAILARHDIASGQTTVDRTAKDVTAGVRGA